MTEHPIECDSCGARLDVEWEPQLFVACDDGDACPCERCGAPFILWNETDGVLADPRSFSTYEDARRAAEEFRGRFASQGYYLTARQERIDPRSVDLRVVPERDLLER